MAFKFYAISSVGCIRERLFEESFLKVQSAFLGHRNNNKKHLFYHESHKRLASNSVAEWLERLPCIRKVVGSIPTECSCFTIDVMLNELRSKNGVPSGV
jgi:hypothetical protein